MDKFLISTDMGEARLRELLAKFRGPPADHDIFTKHQVSNFQCGPGAGDKLDWWAFFDVPGQDIGPLKRQVVTVQAKVKAGSIQVVVHCPEAAANQEDAYLFVKEVIQLSLPVNSG